MNSDHTTDPTTCGMQEGFDYTNFAFSDDFRIPTAYVVAYSMAHFRGPDTHLWFAPEMDTDSTRIDWHNPQNVAKYDQRQGDGGNNAYHTDPEYQETMADLCRALDALIAAHHRYNQWGKTPRPDPTATNGQTCSQ